MKLLSRCTQAKYQDNTTTMEPITQTHTTDMDVDDELLQYKDKVFNYCNRIIRENRLSVDQSTTSEGKLMYSIKFLRPEWFTELDHDIQYNIMTNLQRHYKDMIKNYFKEYNVCKKRKLEDGDDGDRGYDSDGC